jgi:hypothetical protein
MVAFFNVNCLRCTTAWRCYQFANKKSVANYPLTPRDVAEERKPQLHRSDSLKFLKSRRVTSLEINWETISTVFWIGREQLLTFIVPQLFGHLKKHKFINVNGDYVEA